MKVDFFVYRKWFNRRFSLSFGGKFFGLGRLLELGIFELFVYKLHKMLERPKRFGRWRNSVLLLTIKGVSIKLYPR